MSGNGKNETAEKTPYTGGGLFSRTRQPLFEKDLLTAGQTILDSLPTAVFRDEQALNDTCLYLGWLDMHDLQEEIAVALWKINGSMAIEGRARDDAIQAHGELYYPRHATKEDKKWIAMMQHRMREDEDVMKGGRESGGGS